jgi:DNA-binding MarR family transcriptional regulator
MSRTNPEDQPVGRYAYDGLDRVMHEKARLGILTSLATHPEGVVFSELKALCALTDGNLSRHLQILQEAGLVEVLKGTNGNRPQTLCQLTRAGRQKFLDYIHVLEAVVADAALASKQKATPARRSGGGWSPA